MRGIHNYVFTYNIYVHSVYGTLYADADIAIYHHKKHGLPERLEREGIKG